MHDPWLSERKALHLLLKYCQRNVEGNNPSSTENYGKSRDKDPLSDKKGTLVFCKTAKEEDDCRG